MRVLVIPEDFRKDQYILEPIVSTMLSEVGKPRAIVRVCRDPLLGSVSQALNWRRIEEVLARYRGMVDVFLLCVDRDGDASRRGRLDYLEQQAQQILFAPRIFLAENAWQEIEVWVLAGHDLPSEWAWLQIRSERNPKAIYFEPFTRTRGLTEAVAGGRKTLATEAAARYGRIRQLCPEDIGALEGRIREWIETHSA